MKNKNNNVFLFALIVGVAIIAFVILSLPQSTPTPTPKVTSTATATPPPTSTPTPLPTILQGGSPSWSVDGYVATITHAGWVFIYAPHDIVAIPAVPGATIIAWSPRQPYLAIAAGASLQLLDAAGNVIYSRSIGGEVESLVWSPDGRYISLGEKDQTVILSLNLGQPPP